MGTISHRISGVGGAGGAHWNLHERYRAPNLPMAPAAPVMHLLLTKAPDQGEERTVREERTRWPLHSPSQHSSHAASTGHPARARQALPAKELAHLLRSTSAITFPLDPQATTPGGPLSRILPPPPDKYQSPSSLVLKYYLCFTGPTGNQGLRSWRSTEHYCLR